MTDLPVLLPKRTYLIQVLERLDTSVIRGFWTWKCFSRDHVAQYPLDVAQKKTMSNVLAIQVDAEGKTKYDAIA